MSRRGSAVLAEEELIDLNIELQANPKSENAKKAKSVLINHKAIEAAGKKKTRRCVKVRGRGHRIGPVQSYATSQQSRVSGP